MDELVEDFIVETKEGLDNLDNDLLTLEKNPQDEEVIGNIFRVMHTIKGTCGFLGLHRLEHVAHAGEDVFDQIRSKNLDINEEIISLIFKAIDQIKAITDYLEENGEEPEGNDNAIITALRACASGENSAPAAVPPVEETPVQISSPPPQGGISSDNADLQKLFDETESLVDTGTPATQEASKPAPPQGGISSDNDDLQKLFDETESLVDISNPADKEPAKEVVAAKKEEVKDNSKPETKKSMAVPTIRVGIDVLEELMQHASELVLTRNQLLQILRKTPSESFNTALQRLNSITTNLQEGVMKTRMQPVGNAWTKLPRIVRDLGSSLDKKIDLQMSGEDTELDRQLLEMITDPLTHMVRNSADHGLEDTKDRVAAGKPEIGVIQLKAFHGGGYIIIEISDDGGGIDPAVIKRKAIEKGLVTEADADEMNDHQILQFIFAAGFSTAAQVTAVSGRGVGMDVVRSNIEKISGIIDLQSTLGKGTTFSIKIPLTLAIMPILQVAVHGQRFAIPQINVIEIVKANSSSGFNVETLNNKPILRLREKLLPLASLSEVLALGECEYDNKEVAKFIVVCEVGSYNFGIVVDQVFDTEEIVVKPVSPILKGIEAYSGSTILGDGSVVLIIDPNGVAKSTGEITGSNKDLNPHGEDEHLSGETASFIVFKAGDDTPKVVPLEIISRLEEIDCSKIEMSRGQPVLQYRDNLMRIATIDPSYEIPSEGMQEVLVISRGEQIMGLAVEEIIDIERCILEKELSSGENGFIDSIVINDRACDVVDISYHFSNTFKDVTNDPIKEPTSEKRVMLIDDSPFFRKFIPPELRSAGYDVETFPSADDALEELGKNPNFSLVITDMIMPGISGQEFASTCKSDKKLSHLPIIALSSHVDESEQSGEELSMFDAIVSKTHHESLVDIVESLIK